jgi:hypothetical protein
MNRGVYIGSMKGMDRGVNRASILEVVTGVYREIMMGMNIKF